MQHLSEIVFLISATILIQICRVRSHGRLILPPQRSSAWRFGYNNPPNYNDNELFCGGAGVQWNSINNGRCGVCGDPYSNVIKPNEDVDGIYVRNNVITGRYDAGQTFTVKVEITANHLGWFEFRLCPLETPNTKVTQECLNRTLLQEAGSSTTRFRLNTSNTGLFEYSLQLPASLTCERCVLQWKYNTGNSWGCEASGCGVGLGKQENFVNCADIQIRDNSVTSSTTQSSGQSATMSALTSSATSESTPSNTTTAHLSTTTTTTTSSTSSTTTSTTQTTTSTGSITSPRTIPNGKVCSSKLTCTATPAYSKVVGILDWCCSNCAATPVFCPTSHCICERS